MCGSSFRLNLGYHGTELLVRDFCFYIQLTGLILFQVSLTCNFGGQPECCESCAAERSPSTLEKQDIFQAFVWPVVGVGVRSDRTDQSGSSFFTKLRSLKNRDRSVF
jgi:hypothetical protein